MQSFRRGLRHLHLGEPRGQLLDRDVEERRVLHERHKGAKAHVADAHSALPERQSRADAPGGDDDRKVDRIEERVSHRVAVHAIGQDPKLREVLLLAHQGLARAHPHDCFVE